MESSSLIFIPDISGFTTFVNKVEIEHSNHIISELIGVILSSNVLNLKVSEIEGDAILFYRPGEAPTAEELVSQSKKMFLDFHGFLKVIELGGVCLCGACSAASNLTLKFITHYGELREVAIHNFNKLIGKDVILAHKLLKNSIPSKEYLLLSEKYLQTQQSGLHVQADWVTIEQSNELAGEFGEISTRYIPLTPLKKLVPAPLKLEETTISGNPVNLSIDINAPMLLVHQTLIDAESRLRWVNGLRSVKNADPITRISSSHTCIFDELEIELVTKRNVVNGDGIEYAERATTNIGFNFVSDYTLKARNGSTTLVLNIIPEEGSKNPQVMLENLSANFEKSLDLLKKYCEKVFAESRSVLEHS
jgi:hypothetical protein